MSKSLPPLLLYPLGTGLYIPALNVVLMMLLDKFPNIVNGIGAWQYAIALMAFNALFINLVCKYSAPHKLNVFFACLCVVVGTGLHYFINDFANFDTVITLYGINVASLVCAVGLLKLSKKYISEQSK